MKMECYPWEFLRFKVTSQTRDNVEYIVDLGEDLPHCTCPDFECKKKKLRGECKHIKLAKEYLMQKFLTDLRNQKHG